MEYNLTPEQLDRIIKPYFDKEFKHAKWGEDVSSNSNDVWYGVINQDNIMLVGHQSDNNDMYFTNGEYFNNMWDLFSVNPQDFNESMGRFIKKKYGCEFKKIM